MQTKIQQLLEAAIIKLKQQAIIPSELTVAIIIDHPKKSEHGDYSSNIALLIAKAIGQAPMKVAAAIVDLIQKEQKDKQLKNFLSKVEIASPGFINFYLANESFHQTVNDILKANKNYGHCDIGKNKYVMVEFVSANPTGPLHVGHGRGAAFGASVANLLDTQGFKVHREYYVNDAGRQMQVLTLSIWLRYLEIDAEIPHFPCSGYKGDYIIDIARNLKVEHGSRLHRDLKLLYENLPADENTGGDKEFYVDAIIKRAQDLLGKNDYDLIFQAGLKSILTDIRQDLEEFGLVYQEWFYESHLYKNGDVAKGIERLRSRGFIYEKDGATWFKATAFGDEKDRVLIRSNKQFTYFASDIGYHLNKYERGFDKIIDIFGADHHGYEPRIRGFLQALGLDVNSLDVLLVQFAILYRGKQKVSMSTRGGEFVTLRTLREEVGNDAARFFYITRKNDQHLDFDLELAKSRSAENPIYYIQYAHARICSVHHQLGEKQLTYDQDLGLANLALLKNEHEQSLYRTLNYYIEVLQNSALNYEPHVFANYLLKLATEFHAYYNAHQFLVDDALLRNARLCLIDAVRQILVNGLTILGVSAPEVM